MLIRPFQAQTPPSSSLRCIPICIHSCIVLSLSSSLASCTFLCIHFDSSCIFHLISRNTLVGAYESDDACARHILQHFRTIIYWCRSHNFTGARLCCGIFLLVLHKAYIPWNISIESSFAKDIFALILMHEK